VLYLVGVNDIGRGEPNAFDEGSRPIARSDAPTPGPWVRLARHSRVASLALNAYRMVRAFRWSLGHGQVDLLSVEHVDKNADNGPTMDHDPYLRGYQQRLAALVASSREHGMQPVLVTQPLLYGAGVDPTTGVDLATVRIRDLGGSTAWRLMERYNDVTRRLGRVADVPVIDLAAEMPKDSRYYYDWMHYTPAGSEMVANVIASHLCPIVHARFPDHSTGDCPDIAQPEPAN